MNWNLKENNYNCFFCLLTKNCLFFLINSLFVTQKSITRFFFRFYQKEINNFPDVFEWSLSWLRVCTEDSTWCVRGTKLFLFSPAVFTQQNINSSTTNVWNKFIILFSSVREFFQLFVFVSFNCPKDSQNIIPTCNINWWRFFIVSTKTLILLIHDHSVNQDMKSIYFDSISLR